MTAEEWITAYAAKLGIDGPDAETIQTLLSLAGVAAHASARQAAPVSTWLAAQSGLGADAALKRAEDLAAELQAQDLTSEIG